MTTTLLSILRHAGPPVANHLWQSTAFVAAIGLLTLLFARNPARIRSGLWLAASAKFLIPFSLLMAFGSVIPLSNRAIPALQPSLILAVHAVNQPFSAAAPAQDIMAHTFLQRVALWLPAALALIWALGFAAVLLAWYARWRQVSKMIGRAVPAEDTREAEILRRMEHGTPPRTHTRFLISSDLMEPGVFGIFHPVLLWPAQLSHRLEDAHLEAILAHEVAHVHRRDNLAALIHMAVEAVFWFHPFVWWIEKRMLEERERACDEAVLQSGSPAEIYADSLLKVSRFCVELPLPCASGITGADLSKRIRSIMARRFTSVNAGKRLLLAALAAGAVAGPVAFGLLQRVPIAAQILQASGPVPSFEVASIRRSPSRSGPTDFGAAGIGAPIDRFIARNTTIQTLMQWAWTSGKSLLLPEDRISGGPGWIDSDTYDFDAKLDDSQVAALEKLGPWERTDHVRLMVQSLLADRFKLQVKYTTVTRPVYALVIARGGAKLKQTAPGSSPPANLPQPPSPQCGPSTAPQGAAAAPCPYLISHRYELIAFEQPMSVLASWLQLQVGRPVLDQTGLKGKYSFDFKLTPDLTSPGAMPGPAPGGEIAPLDTSGPSIFTAVQEQLGLKLESTKGPEASIVIVHIEKPSQN